MLTSQILELKEDLGKVKIDAKNRELKDDEENEAVRVLVGEVRE